ncbi:hypothetical protein ACIBCD_28240 [Nocardia brasiliensis]|uniref:hypothetical protein n=1 Tax=Nocardia brasiliensis TaxID=37326 RepID=UPI00378922F9
MSSNEDVSAQHIDTELQKDLASCGFSVVDVRNGEISIGRTMKNGKPMGSVSLLTEMIPVVLGQLKQGARALADYVGYSNNEHFAEIQLRGGFQLGRPIWRELERQITPPPWRCKHDTACLTVTDPGAQRSEHPIHVTDPVSGVCLEISPVSPCALLFGREFPVEVGYLPYSQRGIYSLKIDGLSFEIRDGTSADLTSLVDSFLYELSVRNAIVLETVRPISLARVGRISPWREPEAGVRYPKSRINPQVAQIFGFAESARRNPSLAYLSYYQVLEFYFPHATRRHAIRAVRKELNDPYFEDSDDGILRVISAAEGGTNSSEAQAIGILLSESIRRKKLKEFFAIGDFAVHFSKKGPITGVENINVDNKTKGLTDQVADRVYQLRNRIVHAKDDPRYENVKFLLPKGPESDCLGPDLELVRVLAIEVIIEFQS